MTLSSGLPTVDIPPEGGPATTIADVLPLTLALVEPLGLRAACLPAQRPFDAYGYWQFKVDDNGKRYLWPTGHTIQEYHRWPSVTFGLQVMEAYYQDIQNYLFPPQPVEEVVEEPETPVEEVISTEEPTA